jgi:hypothetical protein
MSRLAVVCKATWVGNVVRAEIPVCVVSGFSPGISNKSAYGDPPPNDPYSSYNFEDKFVEQSSPMSPFRTADMKAKPSL